MTYRQICWKETHRQQKVNFVVVTCLHAVEGCEVGIGIPSDQNWDFSINAS